MVTAYDVARQAGVSVGTVSRYLTGNGYVGAESTAKIARAIDELGYIRNRAAASLRTKQTGLLGFVVSDLRNPFTAEIASALSRRARALGYGLVLSESANSARVALEAIQSMQTHGIDGLVITPPESRALNQALVKAVATLPVVGIGLRTQPLVTDLVTSDTRAGAIAATRHLLDLGHMRIAYVGSRNMASGRYRGYASAMQTAGTEPGPESTFFGDLDKATGLVALRQFLAQPVPPTAVFAANDAIALGILQACHEAGVRIPDDLSVVGFDDIELAQHTSPALTTVAQPTTEMGEAAIDLLVARLRDEIPEKEPRQLVLTSELRIRESTASADGTEQGADVRSEMKEQ